MNCKCKTTLWSMLAGAAVGCTALSLLAGKKARRCAMDNMKEMAEDKYDCMARECRKMKRCVARMTESMEA